MIERYSFISFDMWELVKDVFPSAVTYGDSKIVQYASNEDGTLSDDAIMLLSKVNQHGLGIVLHDSVNAQMIIDAIETGIDKVYNCNRDVALVVCQYFTPEEING